MPAEGRALCQNGNKCVKVRKEVRGKFRVHCVASSPLIHVGMCRMIGARSVAECEFSFAALKCSQTLYLPACKSTEEC